MRLITVFFNIDASLTFRSEDGVVINHHDVGRSIEHLLSGKEGVELTFFKPTFSSWRYEPSHLPGTSPDPRDALMIVTDEKDATIARLSAELALTREALDRYARLDPDGARAAIAKLSEGV